MQDASVGPHFASFIHRRLLSGVLVVAAIATWLPPFLLIAPRDYFDFLLPWYNHILSAGTIDAFSHPFSNYTPPYLYLLAVSTLPGLPALIAMKLLSSAGALWTSWATYRLLTVQKAAGALEGGIATLLLPTVMLNVPVLAQADMFWVAPSLLAIAAAIEDRTLAMSIWAGVAFAFKAQAVFIAPFVAAMLIKQRATWWCWIIPALVYIVAMLPAWMAGWPISDLLGVYLRQAEYVPPNGIRFVSTASNWWALFAYFDYKDAVDSYWIGYAAATAACIIYVRHFAVNATDRLAAAALSTVILPFLLPGMHERFYALGELAVFCSAWASRSRPMVAAALLMQVQLVLATLGWILKEPRLTFAGAALVTVVVFILLRARRGRNRDRTRFIYHIASERG